MVKTSTLPSPTASNAEPALTGDTNMTGEDDDDSSIITNNTTVVNADPSAALTSSTTEVHPAVTNSESKDSDTSIHDSNMSPDETQEVLATFANLFDDDQTPTTAAAKTAKAIVDVSTNPTDTQSLPQEQQDTPSVLECNSFMQTLEQRVSETIRATRIEQNQLSTDSAGLRCQRLVNDLLFLTI